MLDFLLAHEPLPHSSANTGQREGKTPRGEGSQARAAQQAGRTAFSAPGTACPPREAETLAGCDKWPLANGKTSEPGGPTGGNEKSHALGKAGKAELT